MESDGDLYQIKKFPKVYYFFVLRFASELIQTITVSDIKRSSKAKEFEDACYLLLEEPYTGVQKDILRFIAIEVVNLNFILSDKGFLGPYVECEKLSLEKLELFYKLVAKLEFYGFLCQSPRSLKGDDNNEICLDFLSDWAKKVIVKATWQEKGIRFVEFKFGWFARRERDFKTPIFELKVKKRKRLPRNGGGKGNKAIC